MEYKLLIVAQSGENKVNVNAEVSEDLVRRILNLITIDGIKGMTKEQLQEVIDSLDEQMKANQPQQTNESGR